MIVLAVIANGMSDAPSMGFQYGWAVIAAWVIVGIMWLIWWVG